MGNRILSYLTMNFCDECNNLQVPIENKKLHQLFFKCIKCGTMEKRELNISIEKQNKVYENYIQATESASIQSIVNPDVIMDPTLPRTGDVPCPVCDHQEAVFFQIKSINEDEAMGLIFVCCNVDCKYFWKG